MISRLALFAALSLAAQTPEPPVHVGPGVTPPKAIKHPEPEYPEEGRNAGKHGTVVVAGVVDATGHVTDLRLLRPAGFGFDEEAQKAVRKWQFSPGMKDGKPVAVAITIEVNFKLLSRNIPPPIAAKIKDAAKKMAEFNVAITEFQQSDPVISRKGLQSVIAMAKAGYAPAQYSYGVWQTSGYKVPKDPPAGLKLLLASAERGHTPAQAQAGIYYYEGRNVAQNKAKGLELLLAAAEKDGTLAQMYLGDQERESNPELAAMYFRRCAARNQPVCQTLLAEYLLKQTATYRPEAVAWLELAAKQNHEPASILLKHHAATLTPEERAHADALGKMLLPK